MKILGGAALLLVLAAMTSPGRDPLGLPLGPKEPVCGFTKDFHYLDATQVSNGLSVQMAVVGSARLNEPAVLRFTVVQKPENFAVNKLQVEHEKLMHVIGVRDDLSEFFHIHPTQVAPGIWEVPFTFTNGGAYKLWTDVRYQDSSYAFSHPLLSVPGIIAVPATNADQPDYEVRSGYQITFKHTSPLIAGRNANLEFLIRDAAGREIETENFLGAPMHLVLVKDDLSVYRHAHPDHQEPPQPTISFTQNLPQAGSYKLFAQFRPKGTGLKADEAILAEFMVEVVK